MEGNITIEYVTNDVPKFEQNITFNTKGNISISNLHRSLRQPTLIPLTTDIRKYICLYV